MENWRKKGDKYNPEFSRRNFNNHYRKPPLGGNPNYVPSWEKRFVSSVGSLSWKKFLEAKKFTYLYDNIMKWDDSAGKEAFQTAKHRFYSKIHGLPCEVDHNNPDLYIDKINWDYEVDPKMMLDLESEPVIHEVDGEHEPVVIFGDVLPDPYKSYSPFGWGDCDDKNENSWGTSNELKRDENGVNWDDYIHKDLFNGDNCDVGGGNYWLDSNENDDKTGDQVWNANKCDNYNDYPSYGNGNNNQRNRSWRNNGNRKSNGQSIGKQRGYRSTLQAHGSQRVHVQP